MNTCMKIGFEFCQEVQTLQESRPPWLQEPRANEEDTLEVKVEHLDSSKRKLYIEKNKSEI